MIGFSLRFEGGAAAALAGVVSVLRCERRS